MFDIRLEYEGKQCVFLGKEWFIENRVELSHRYLGPKGGQGGEGVGRKRGEKDVSVYGCITIL